MDEVHDIGFDAGFTSDGVGDIQFNGYMPFSKLLDFLHERFDRYGDCMVVVDGKIRTTDFLGEPT